jgi:hypothetical protein
MMLSALVLTPSPAAPDPAHAICVTDVLRSTLVAAKDERGLSGGGGTFGADRFGPAARSVAQFTRVINRWPALTLPRESVRTEPWWSMCGHVL